MNRIKSEERKPFFTITEFRISDSNERIESDQSIITSIFHETSVQTVKIEIIFETEMLVEICHTEKTFSCSVIHHESLDAIQLLFEIWNIEF